MSIKISYKKGIQEKLVKNYVLFANEDFKINGLNKLPLGKQSSQINKIIKSNYSKKKEFIFFNHNSDQKIVLIKIKNNQTSTENEKKGANFYNFVKSNIRWQKVLDNRFGYKINNLPMQDTIPVAPTPKRIEKEYEFSEIFISYEQWDPKNAKLIANRLEIELKAGADFEKAVERFSSAASKIKKGKVGPIKKSRLPKQFRDILDGLNKNQISRPLEINGGLVLLRLNKTRSYKTMKTPKLSVTYSIVSAQLTQDNACSEEKEIKGPISLSKVDKNIRNILAKLMPGESYKFSDKSGLMRLITLCESFINENHNGGLNYENIKKNEEALRLSNALMLELRRNTTIVKK